MSTRIPFNFGLLGHTSEHTRTRAYLYARRRCATQLVVFTAKRIRGCLNTSCNIYTHIVYVHIFMYINVCIHVLYSTRRWCALFRETFAETRKQRTLPPHGVVDGLYCIIDKKIIPRDLKKKNNPNMRVYVYEWYVYDIYTHTHACRLALCNARNCWNDNPRKPPLSVISAYWIRVCIHIIINTYIHT